jgi:hypothetical protein
VTAFIPTTTVDILRGETTDSYGDAADASTVAASAVPVSIIETQRRVFVPAEGRRTVVRMLTGRARPEVDVQEGDRLRDTTDQSTIYLVEAVSRPQSPVGRADARLELRRIDS